MKPSGLSLCCSLTLPSSVLFMTRQILPVVSSWLSVPRVKPATQQSTWESTDSPGVTDAQSQWPGLGSKAVLEICCFSPRKSRGGMGESWDCVTRMEEITAQETKTLLYSTISLINWTWETQERDGQVCEQRGLWEPKEKSALEVSSETHFTHPDVTPACSVWILQQHLSSLWFVFYPDNSLYLSSLSRLPRNPWYFLFSTEQFHSRNFK